jgi:trehalose-6-phosphate synthase
VIERLELPADVCLAVGVDRFDYTKGILERLNAVERLLEKWPSWIGRFVFVQVAAPTRGALDEYRSFQERVQRTSERINERFGRPGYQPVHLLAQHHEHDAVFELFPRCQHLRGDQPARRHEPGLQGIRRRTRRPAGRAAAQPLRRCGA